MYIIHATHNNVLFLIDDNTGRSITNSADYITSLFRQFDRIIYRDTSGRWDELLHEAGSFKGFAPLSTDDQLQFQPFITPLAK